VKRPAADDADAIHESPVFSLNRLPGAGAGRLGGLVI
jgi:hypothetical protein